MENNFNLRKFLVENRLTVGSKQIKEGSDYGYERTMNAVDDMFEPGTPEHDQLIDAVEDAFHKGDIDYSEYSHSPSAPSQQVAAIAREIGLELANESGEVSEEENGGTFFKATVNLADKPGYDYGYTLYAQDEESAKAELASKLQGQEYQVKDLKGPFTSQPEQGELSSRVDKSSIELDGVDSSDYPDFTDAFIAAANFEDGTPLTDDELDQLGDEMADEIHQMAYDSLMEGLTKREKTLKEAVLKALNESKKKKNTANQLRSIVKQIIKEEVSSGNSTQIVLYTNEMGMVGAKSRENVTNQTKMVEALKNSVTVNFTIRYIHEKGSTGNDLVVGTLTPVSRGKDDGTGRPRPVAEVEIKLYSKYAEQNRNYEGRESVNDTLQLIMRYGQNSAENMIKNNSSQQAEPVNERLMKGLTKREKTLKEAVLKALK
jgi:hypothetical protein